MEVLTVFLFCFYLFIFARRGNNIKDKKDEKHKKLGLVQKSKFKKQYEIYWNWHLRYQDTIRGWGGR